MKNLNFDELSNDENIRIEEAMYDMMAQFKVTPLELDNTLPKELNSLIENKWHYCLDMERQIREAIMANLFSNLKKGKIKNIVKEYNHKFKPRERAFLILQKKITELEEKTTKAWKVIYGLAVPKLGQEDPFMDM